MKYDFDYFSFRARRRPHLSARMPAAPVLCAAADLDALVGSASCAVSALVPALAGILLLVLAAVRLGQISAPRHSLLLLPTATARARGLALGSCCASALASAAVRWRAAGELERTALALYAASWLAALAAAALGGAAGGRWFATACAGLAACAAAPGALGLAGAAAAAQWIEDDAPTERVAAAAAALAAALALLAEAAAEACGGLAIAAAPPLLEPLLAPTSDLDGAGEAAASAGVCPERSAGLLSRLVFEWMSPTLARGAATPLSPADLWRLDTPDSCAALAAQWAKAAAGAGAVARLRVVVGRGFLAGPRRARRPR
jgi:hypothetical protein